MAKNDNLHKAKRAKADEFYTQLSDIENECKHYWEHFKGKTILCNCDDPRVSNFFRYFSLKFEDLGLKKLIATCYKSNQIEMFSQQNTERAVYIEYYGDKNGNRQVDDNELEVKELQNDGDFRSAECIELLKEADIVVTNPPFSLFREYVAQLVAFEKKFLIIGHQNAITYKEIFPLLKENKMWLGYGFKGSAGHFISKYQDIATAGDHREGMIRVSGVTWFTNLEHKKRHEELILYKEYNPEKFPNEYPKYENYNAIEVSKTAEIPMNYDGVMGVPVTFMYKYNPDQFEIIGMAEDNGKGLSGEAAEWDRLNPHCIINGKAMYKRIFIRKK
ncbi:MAG: adenine-specific methyltransferase EcoRI family protein [Bacteroidales bacterium]|nr:adenine-specific methyltransferase EcoRI family protein [Bacteroidales bacterium]